MLYERSGASGSSQMGSLARAGSAVTVNGPKPSLFSARTLNR